MMKRVLFILAACVALAGCSTAPKGASATAEKKLEYDSPSVVAFHKAVAGGDMAVVRSLAKADPRLVRASDYDWPPLHLAAKSGRVEVVRFLISKGADVNRRWWVSGDDVDFVPQDGCCIEGPYSIRLTTLDIAVAFGHEDVAKLLIAQGARLDIGHAAGLGMIENVREFLRKDPGLINARGANEWTPLYWAARTGRLHVVEFLLNEGALVNAKVDGVHIEPAYRSEDETALHAAAMGGHPEVAALLIRRGANIHADDGDWITPLHIAACSGSMPVARLLVSKGARVKAKGRNGITALHLAALRGHREMAEFLLANGERVAPIKNGWITPLHMAAEGGHRDVAELLLARGANVDSGPEGGWRTPILMAAVGGHTDVVKFLLQHGASRRVFFSDPDADFSLGHSEDVSWRLEGGLPMAKLLLGAQDVPKAGLSRYARMAIQDRKSDVARFLIERGADVNYAHRFGSGLSLLQMAVINRDDDLVRLLRSKGATLDIYSAAALGLKEEIKQMLAKDPDVVKREDPSPLYGAIGYGQMDVVKLLIANGADVNGSKPSSWTPLHAAAAGKPEIVRLLIEKGADVNANAEYGGTPLCRALSEGSREAAWVLIRHGAKITPVDSVDSDPLAQATRKGFVDLVRLFLRRVRYPKPHLDRALKEAVRYRAPGEVVSREDVTIAELLVDNGADASAGLRMAVRHSSDEMFRLMLAKGADVPRSKALLSVGRNQLAMAKELIARGADVNAAGISGHTALSNAAEAGDIKSVRFLLAHGADPNTVDKDGHTPLYLAALSDHRETAELLIKNGANSNPTTKGQSLIGELVGWRRQYAMVRFLVDHGAKLNIWTAAALGETENVAELLKEDPKRLNALSPGYRKRTPLSCAVARGHLQTCKLLLDKGAKVMSGSGAVECGDAAVLKLLAKHGADLNAKDKRGDAPLHHAVSRRDKTVTRALLAAGAQVDAKGQYSEAPLHRAGYELAWILLKHGADPNVKDKRGRTPLFGRWVELDRYELLLKHGANPNATDKFGRTPLFTAPPDEAKLLLKSGCKIGHRDKDGRTALHLQPPDVERDGTDDEEDIDVSDEYEQSDATARFLIAKGANINAKDKHGKPPLYYAVFRDTEEYAMFLVANGADVNFDVDHGMTPLHYAVLTDAEEYVKLLLERGADVNVKDEAGKTPLHYAVDHGREEYVKLLLAKGADVNAKDNKGRTPLDYVSGAMAKLLKKHGAKTQERPPNEGDDDQDD